MPVICNLRYFRLLAGDRIERLKLLPLQSVLCGTVFKISDSLHVKLDTVDV